VIAEHRIRTTRGSLFAREWRGGNSGHAPPIILLHDSLGCVELWRDFPEQLCAKTGRRIIAYDRLGFGRSDSFAGLLPLDFIYTECAFSLPPLREALRLESFVIFGHSVGGGMGVVGASHFGSACAGLISVSAQIFREERTFDGIRHARAVFAPGTPQYERLTRYHGAKADWVLHAWTGNWLNPDFSLDLSPYMRRIGCPVLAIHGDRDEYGSIAQPKMLCDSVSGPASLKIFPDCGHVPHRERPLDVLNAVADFLESR
jgi:pimeloyl-ACP methyl ester carboxylesterase